MAEEYDIHRNPDDCKPTYHIMAACHQQQLKDQDQHNDQHPCCHLVFILVRNCELDQTLCLCLYPFVYRKIAEITV